MKSRAYDRESKLELHKETSDKIIRYVLASDNFLLIMLMCDMARWKVILVNCIAFSVVFSYFKKKVTEFMSKTFQWSHSEINLELQMGWFDGN